MTNPYDASAVGESTVNEFPPTVTEPVTSIGDVNAPITIQGDDGAGSAVAVLAFVAPLIIIVLALWGGYQLFRWIERRQG